MSRVRGFLMCTCFVFVHCRKFGKQVIIKKIKILHSTDFFCSKLFFPYKVLGHIIHTGFVLFGEVL